jgi:hypothetical protein
MEEKLQAARTLKITPTVRVSFGDPIRIRMFLGFPDPDPLVRGMDPNPDPAPDPSLF